MLNTQEIDDNGASSQSIIGQSANSELSGRINGKFAPGFSGNPLGRPKSRHITEELKARLESGDAEVIGSQLIEMAKDKSDKWLALAATKEVVDRTEGKAMQRSIVGVTVDPNALTRLNELADKLNLG